MNLWPFKDASEAAAWQASYRSGGHSPWHVDADLTALSFTQGYLGFQNIDTVTSHQVDGVDAHIGVGYKIEPGKTATAAVLHLRRFGTDQDSPWEVVGSADTTLTIPQPRYGDHVTSPLIASGLITGVDESLHVAVHSQSAGSAVGEKCCIGAGGDKQPWSATVPFDAGADQVLTIVVSTGGHVAAVERFAITGVRAG